MRDKYKMTQKENIFLAKRNIKYREIKATTFGCFYNIKILLNSIREYDIIYI